MFLAQLSNLLAGNISIVHKVTGSSRTFMGEEGAGISAVDTAVARIRSGQSTHALVGGAFQTEHPDMLLGYELAGYLHRGPLDAGLAETGHGGRRRRHRIGRCVPGAGTARARRKPRAHSIYAELGPGRIRPRKYAAAASFDAEIVPR